MRGVQAKRLRRKAWTLVDQQVKDRSRMSGASLQFLYRRVYRGLKRRFKEA